METIYDYESVFRAFERSLKQLSLLSSEDFDRHTSWTRNLDYRKEKDEEFYWILTYVVFYSGMRASVIEGKLPVIRECLGDYNRVANFSDADASEAITRIGFRNKVPACISNAREFCRVIDEFGSFGHYIASFGIDGERSLEKLKRDLRKRFAFISGITVNHFLTDVWFPVIKPDRVLCRIFFRLGLIDSEDDTVGALREWKRFSEVTHEPFRYIDWIFVRYWQMGAYEDLNISDGICLKKNPKCSQCSAKKWCQWGKQA